MFFDHELHRLDVDFWDVCELILFDSVVSTIIYVLGLASRNISSENDLDVPRYYS